MSVIYIGLNIKKTVYIDNVNGNKSETAKPLKGDITQNHINMLM